MITRRRFLGATLGAVAGLLGGQAAVLAQQGTATRQFYLVQLKRRAGLSADGQVELRGRYPIWWQASLRQQDVNDLTTHHRLSIRGVLYEADLWGGPYQTQAEVCAAARPLIDTEADVYLSEECLGSRGSGGRNTEGRGNRTTAEQQFRRNAAASIAGAAVGTAAGLFVPSAAAAAGAAAGALEGAKAHIAEALERHRLREELANRIREDRNELDGLRLKLHGLLEPWVHELTYVAATGAALHVALHVLTKDRPHSPLKVVALVGSVLAAIELALVKVEMKLADWFGLKESIQNTLHAMEAIRLRTNQDKRQLLELNLVDDPVNQPDEVFLDDPVNSPYGLLRIEEESYLGGKGEEKE